MHLSKILPALSVAALAALSAEPSTDRKTVWSGVYTAKQAEQGAAVYAASCSRCHREDLSGYTGLRSSKFRENWREDNLSSLWTRLSKTMPVGAPGSLEDGEYLAILAYILQANEFPAGSQELKVANLAEIRFEGKNGAGPVPDFSLVEVVGCLSSDPDSMWRVNQSTEPVRTRNPNDSSASERETAGAQRLGAKTFRILDGSALKMDVHNGRKVKVKGFLILKPNDDRLSTTSVEVVAASCK